MLSGLHLRDEKFTLNHLVVTYFGAGERISFLGLPLVPALDVLENRSQMFLSQFWADVMPPNRN